MLALIFAAPAAILSAAPSAKLAEAAHALSVGRTSQARAMVGDAIGEGASGEPVDRLLADLAFAERKYDQALVRYEALYAAHPKEGRLAEQAGLAALHVRQVGKATAILGRATTLQGSTWRSWNAGGVLADFRADWEAADEAYRQAANRAPGEAAVANNQGWSMMLRGRWRDALPVLEKAKALDPKSDRIAANAELARTAIAEDLPQRRAGETNEAFAARLNDAGVIARLQGDRKRAVAAFTQALEARSSWFERAANNLAQVESKP